MQNKANSMRRVGVVGHFGGTRDFFDGQTIKTKILYRALNDVYGDNEICCLDTYGFRRNPFCFFLKAIKLLVNCENVIIMTDKNGICVFIPLYGFLNAFLRRKLHYNVIGGWLPIFLKKHKLVGFYAKRLTGVYVETNTMKNALDAMGFSNVVIMPNCKDLQRLTQSQLVHPEREPFRLCTFSRVMKEKGIEDAVEVVKAINTTMGRTVYTLDIYGQIDSTQTQWFADLQKSFPEYVRYGGVVPFDKSVEVLKDYFALLFPTKYYTEGIPGTIIDAYAAGVPVISAKWESFPDVIDDKITGYGYGFDDTQAMKSLLLQIARDPEMIIGLKENCLKKAQEYMPGKVIQILTRRMEG